MKYVLDASVAIRWAIPNALTPKALTLRDDFTAGVHDLIAPSIFPGEVANALTKAERQQFIQVGDSLVLIGNVLKSSPALVPYEPLLLRAAEISSRFRCGFYDCCYAALAEREGCELVTADEKFLRAIQATMPFVIGLDTLP